MNVRAMERGDERVVGNGVDRGNVGVVNDDDLATLGGGLHDEPDHSVAGTADGDGERGWTCEQRREGMDMRATKRGDERIVGNCLDRGRVGVVDDDRGMLIQASKQLEYYSTCNGNAK